MSKAFETADRSGAGLMQKLNDHYRGQDWIAALGKLMVKPRQDIEQMFAADQVSDELVLALNALPEALELGDPDATDDVFRASTNDESAAMEVDEESGMVVSPGNKGMPSQSGSEHEMRTKPPKAEKNSQFLPVVGVAEWLAPLHAKKDDS